MGILKYIVHLSNYLAVLLVSLAFTDAAKANHIVGGELELVHEEGFTYRLSLIQYFDKAQTANPGPEPFLVAYIYRKTDNFFMRRDTLWLSEQADVPYTNIDCTLDELKTLRAFYTRLVELPPDDFDDPEGYYVVWERCCRNQGIVNIVNPIGTGQTYYLEFPPVVKNGLPYINSSPALFPPLNDYACVDQLYYTNFAGSDADGDSLVYTLVKPLNSSASVALPLPQPVPHPNVIWTPGIDLDQVIPGSPPLRISRNGFITVKPSQTGLFVFSVLCEEYREGEKIGEVRRDFQMLVIDGCDPPPPPEGYVRTPNSLNFHDEIDTLKYQVGDSKCFDFLVTDKTGGKNIKLRAEPVNFEGDIQNIFSFNQAFINDAFDTLRVQVCVPDCPYVRDEPYLIDLIAADDACPLPQMDTVRVTILVEPPPNAPPSYVNIGSRNITQLLEEGSDYILPLQGIDADNDRMKMEIAASGFEPAEWGIELITTTDEAGNIGAALEWNTGCNLYPFGIKNQFNFSVNLYDDDSCMDEASDQISLSLTVRLPENQPPVLTSSLGSHTLDIPVGQNLSFTLRATDADSDVIDLTAIPLNFSFEDYPILFEPESEVGEVNTTFSWDLGCGKIDLEVQDYFEILFVASDNDYCLQTETDSIFLTITPFIAPNDPPEISVRDVSGNRIGINTLDAIELEVVASDSDNDFLWLDLLEGIELPPSESFSFSRVEGLGEVTGFLRWAPECSLLGGETDGSYKISFLAWDTRCPNPEYDTLSLFIDITDRQSPDQFLPPNIFTPNGDNINDTFSMPDIPVDNCADQFEFFRVVTREGAIVYTSTDREFEWDGDNLPSGTYYYAVKFVNRSYNGILTIQR